MGSDVTGFMIIEFEEAGMTPTRQFRGAPRISGEVCGYAATVDREGVCV
jgi:hypothetical protein